MDNFGGGRSDLFNSGGRWSKGGGIFSKFRGRVWTLDEAMVHYNYTTALIFDQQYFRLRSIFFIL